MGFWNACDQYSANPHLLRLPTWSGLYGAGIYFATDRSKSHGYCGLSQLRGTNFMFICDVIIGVPHMTLDYGDWTEPLLLNTRFSFMI